MSTPQSIENLREEAIRRVPKMGEDLVIKGLDGPIKIIRDSHGVPHAKVTTTHDAWFAQGFIHAQERLWGMERTRRFFHGTLSEIVGDGGLEPDKLYRRVGLMRSAHREWPLIEKEGKEVILAYVEGVNSYLDLGFPLPIEFEILGYNPTKWEPTDVTGRWKLIAYSQSMSGQIKLGRWQTLNALGPRLFSRLFPFYPEDAPTMVPSGQPAGQRDLNPIIKMYEDAHSRSGLLEQNGSNSWVVDGTLTESGRPLLAGDPHLAITVPSFWHVQHIEGPDFAFAGASMPGVPGVTYYGHNHQVAWGMTTSGADAQDLFFEQIRDGSPPQYLFEDRWLNTTINTEIINIKGRKEPVIEKVLETHHGPIISGGPGKDGPAVALQWVGSGLQQTFSSFVAMHSATNIHEFIDSHKKWTSHTNKLMADTQGNIAYMLTGQLPIRRGGPAHVPVPGWTGEHEWDGEVPFEEMPRTINPSTHFSNSSNNLIVSYDFPHYIAPAGNPYRAQRVVQMLNQLQPLNAEKFGQMQSDRFNIPGYRMAQRVKSLKPTTENGTKAHKILSEWDGEHSSESIAGAIYEVLKWKLYDYTLGKLREDMPDPKPTVATLRTFTLAIQDMAERDDKGILKEGYFPFDDWDIPLLQSLEAAAEHLSNTFGEDTSGWSWGNLHTMHFRHGIGREDPAASLLNIQRFGSGGSGETVNAAGHPGGESFNTISLVTYRQILDVGNFDNSLFILPPGQSGHVGSPHYSDLLEDYKAVKYRPLLWNWERIEKEAESEQTLKP